MERDKFEFTFLGRTIEVYPDYVERYSEHQFNIIGCHFSIKCVGIINHGIGAFGKVDKIKFMLAFGTLRFEIELWLKDFIHYKEKDYLETFILLQIFSSGTVKTIQNKI